MQLFLNGILSADELAETLRVLPGYDIPVEGASAEEALAALRREKDPRQLDWVAELADLAVKAEEKYPDNNPKTAMGAKKPDLSVVPPSALLHLATAMMNGAGKYGPFNWRDAPISSRPYIAAALRHLLSFLDGEDFSADTEEAGLPVHHLGHVMACCAIVLDAMEVGTLLDNRPTVPGRTGAMIEHYNNHKRLS